MNIIKRIEIVNFRSIEKVILENGLSDLNIIVGNNDAGKSNILRALNLFFNDETDLGTPFDFDEDFNKNIYRADRRSKYVKVVLDIELKYERNKSLRWTKEWDMNGSISKDEQWVYGNDTLETVDYVSRSRAPGWLSRLKYRYVPAIKGPTYFKHLYEQLHDVLANAYSAQFAEDSGNFITGIQNVTDAITQELTSELGIANRITIPSDFKGLFATLDFGLEGSQGAYYLSKRGDGIKARHIPIILKYLADNEYRALQGSTSVDTIWGFEEPENNLEMRHAFKMAKSFQAYSSQLQIFVTTHSPAFYALKEGNHIKKWFARRDDTNNTEVVKLTEANEVDLDEQMGVLAYITPFVAQKNEELEALQIEKDRLVGQLEDATDRTRCLVFTEDEKDDSALMRRVLEILGFEMSECEVRCYHGKGNLKPAILAADIVVSNMPNLDCVVFHRDRDIDGDATESWVTDELSKPHRSNYRYFLTENYDMESYFLNPQHIHHLYPALSEEIINDRIEQATQAVKEKSLSRIVNSHTQTQAKEKLQNEAKPITRIDFFGLNNEAISLYEGNIPRFRYGKKVYSRLCGLLQQELGSNVDLIQESPHLNIQLLQQIREQLWPSTN